MDQSLASQTEVAETLAAEGVEVHFEGILALDDVDLGEAGVATQSIFFLNRRTQAQVAPECGTR